MPDRNQLIAKLQGFDAAHYARTERYARQIDRLCDAAAKEYAELYAGMPLFAPDENKPFSFDDYPTTKAKAGRIAKGLAAKLEATITSGSKAEWLAATYKNDAFLGSILRTAKLTKEELSQYEDRNLEALKTFQQRKIDGLNLSQRVWKYTGDLRDAMELGIDVALGEGKSAQQLSRDLRQYLREPDKLFRRVRDKGGNLRLSKAAAMYHCGQGVYRSSAKNAQRLARTEINMAYRESEWLRWQNLDFVVGFRVCLSNNHTVLDSKGKPKPLNDICDRLAGDYPKKFKFVGWHPNCRCYVIPILSDYDEYNKNRANRLKAIVKGQEYKSLPSRRTVSAPPQSFTDYVAEIAERAKGWKSMPYYIRDNFVGGKIEGGLKGGVATKQPTGSKPEAAKVVKAKVEPCTEYDGNISTLKRWAYAFGLDVSQLDVLRNAGKRDFLREEVERLEEIADNRQQEWIAATNELYHVIKEAEAEGYADIARKYTDVKNANSCAKERYYADSIANLKAAALQAKDDIAKRKAEEAKKGYSALMPKELRDGSDYLQGESYVFDKRFFDMLKETPTLKIPHKGKGSYESMNGKLVVLDNDSRAKASPWEKKAVVYHEFGHAIADQRKLLFADAVTKLREKQIARLRAKVETTVESTVWDSKKMEFVTTSRKTKIMYAKVLSARIDRVRSRLRRVPEEYFTRLGIKRADFLEQTGSLQDTIKSLVNSEGCGWGHSTNYFNGYGMKEHEYLAHCFENTFLGNRAFQHFMPVEYQEMIDLINSLKF